MDGREDRRDGQNGKPQAVPGQPEESEKDESSGVSGFQRARSLPPFAMMVDVSHFTRAGVLKRGILLFWALWITIVLWMNVGDLLKALGVLPSDWKLASGNLSAIEKVTSIYGVPHWLDILLLSGVIVWQSVSSGLFWWAFRMYHTAHRRRWHAVYLAFSALLGLFGMFILMDEILHAYKVEGDHRGISVLLLSSLLAIQLLPDRIREG
jgi:hypothetical protein